MCLPKMYTEGWFHQDFICNEFALHLSWMLFAGVLTFKRIITQACETTVTNSGKQTGASAETLCRINPQWVSYETTSCCWA